MKNIDLEQQIKSKFSDIIKLKNCILKTRTMTKGTVYTLKRKCGNQNCKCNKNNELHSSICLSYSNKGKTKLKILKTKNEINELKKETIKYKKFRQCRAEIVKKFNQIIKLINQYENKIIKKVGEKNEFI